MLFYDLTSLQVWLIVLVTIVGTTVVGILAGRWLRVRDESKTLKETFGVLQGALLGLVGLILAFGLSMAVGRYDARRAAVVDEANAIGTTWLRAQTLAEPYRARSLEDLTAYAEAAIHLANAVPRSDAAAAAAAREATLQRSLWATATAAMTAAPQDSAPRLYVESLNEMIDVQTVRVAGLMNRVPSPVLAVELFGSAVALGLLAVYLALSSRGVIIVLIASAMVSTLLLVTFDLDRPVRGLVTVPDTPLATLRAQMEVPIVPPGAG